MGKREFSWFKHSCFWTEYTNIWATQQTFTCSKLIIETLEKDKKYVQS